MHVLASFAKIYGILLFCGCIPVGR